MPSRLLPAIVLLLAMFVLPAAAQDRRRDFDTATRSVKGLVTDRAGKAVGGAVVLIKDTKTLQVRSFVTQDDGLYRFHGLSTNDEYELRAQANGTSSNSKTLSAFDNKREATIDLKLK